MQSMQEGHSTYRRRIFRGWRLAFLGILLFVGGAIAEGVIGNFGSDAAHSLLNQLAKSVEMNWVPWIIALACLSMALICLGVAVFAWWNNRFLHQALNVSSNLLDLDDSLLRLLGSWVPDKSHENEMKLLLAEILRDAGRELGEHVYRASILLPDPPGGEYLKVWAYSKLPDETVGRIKFYVGDDENIRRGVAGEVFRTRELRIAHMRQEGNKWKCDCESYISFRERKHPPAYRSFACVPIVGPSPNASAGVTCLGIACFDSLNPTIFDAYDAEIILRVFARRFAAALLLYQLLAPELTNKK